MSTHNQTPPGGNVTDTITETKTPTQELRAAAKTLRCKHRHTVGELVDCDGIRLLDIRSFGATMLLEVVRTLTEHGLELKKSDVPLPSPRRVSPADEQAIREQVAKDLLAVDPAEWALAGQHAGSMSARIARGES